MVASVSQVIGQFNLGFIIGKLDQDLFIMDQVISDLTLFSHTCLICHFHMELVFAIPVFKK